MNFAILFESIIKATGIVSLNYAVYMHSFHLN